MNMTKGKSVFGFAVLFWINMVLADYTPIIRQSDLVVALFAIYGVTHVQFLMIKMMITLERMSRAIASDIADMNKRLLRPSRQKARA